MLHNLPHGGTTTSSSSGVVGEEWSIEALSPWRQARRDVRVRGWRRGGLLVRDSASKQRDYRPPAGPCAAAMRWGR